MCSISLLGLPDPIVSGTLIYEAISVLMITRRRFGEETTWNQWLNDDRKKSYIIIDEAQILYSRAKLFWETVKKLAQERNKASPRYFFCRIW